jgi:hypothetical protein
VREILLNRLRALSAFMAVHINRYQIAILSSSSARMSEGGEVVAPSIRSLPTAMATLVGS